jgi:hypothetical protein
MLEQQKRTDLEKEAKAKKVLEKLKSDSHRWTETTVKVIDKSLHGVVLRQKETEARKAKSLGKVSLPAIREENRKNWEDKLSCISRKVVQKLDKSDKYFNQIMNVLLKSESYTGDWEKLFVLVFKRYSQSSHYNIENLSQPAEIYFEKIENQALAKLRKKSATRRGFEPKSGHKPNVQDIVNRITGSNSRSRGSLTSKKPSSHTPKIVRSISRGTNASLIEQYMPIVLPVNNLHKDTQQEVKPYTIMRQSPPAPVVEPEHDRVQQTNADGIQKKYSHLNYDLNKKNQQAGFNGAVNHEVVIK